MATPLFVEYRSPATVETDSTCGVFSFVGLICGLLTGVVFAIASILAHSVAGLFADFNIKLPTATQVIFATTDFLKSTYFLPLLAAPVIGAFVPSLIDRHIRLSRPHRTLWRLAIGAIIVLAIALVTLLVIVVTLFMPIISMTQGMSGK